MLARSIEHDERVFVKQEATVGASFAEAVIRALPPDSPVPGYLRRLLLSANPAGRALFARWYAMTEQALHQMSAARVLRPAADPPMRAAFLMVNDMAVLLIDVYRDGIFGLEEEP
jgi:TetR/AcrR family transcriptional regulator, regulator of cefoperazone and chloramphenicol sensitivity